MNPAMGGANAEIVVGIISARPLIPVKASTPQQFPTKLAYVKVSPVEMIFQGMVQIAAINEYHHPLRHTLPPYICHADNILSFHYIAY